ncbi:MAG: hypothetical protein AB7O68_09290 [Pirellulales bacterium]
MQLSEALDGHTSRLSKLSYLTRQVAHIWIGTATHISEMFGKPLPRHLLTAAGAAQPWSTSVVRFDLDKLCVD